MCLLALFDLPEAIDGTWLIVFELMTEGQKLESNFMNPEMSPLILFWITLIYGFEAKVQWISACGKSTWRSWGHTSILSQENPWENPLKTHGKMDPWHHGPRKSHGIRSLGWPSDLASAEAASADVQLLKPEVAERLKELEDQLLEASKFLHFSGYLWWAKWRNLARSG